MDEKEVREAIYCMKSFTDDTVCEECDCYDRCDHTMVADNAKTAIEALEKQLPKKVEIWNGQATCPNCKKLYGNMVDIKQLNPASWDFEYCKHCGQRLDWSENRRVEE
mgnify:CR=1 FL=1